MRQIPITEFRSTVQKAAAIRLHMKNPLSPIDASMCFDRAYVTISASPYLCLQSDHGSVTISHIKAITKTKNGATGSSFALTCLDYADPHQPKDVTFDLECEKIA